MNNDVFRFITVRPPQRIDPNEINNQVVRAYGSPREESQFHLQLRNARETEGARPKMVQLAQAFIEPFNSSDFVSDLKNLSLPLGDFDEWVSSSGASANLDGLSQAVERIFGKSVAQLVTSQDYKENRKRVADSLIAVSIYSKGITQVGPRLMRAMRLFGLLERLSANDDTTLNKKGGIAKTLRKIVLLPSDLFPLPTEDSSNRERLLDAHEEAKKAVEKRRKDTENLANQLKHLRNASNELSRTFDADIIERRKATSERPNRPNPNDNNPPVNESENRPSFPVNGEDSNQPQNGERIAFSDEIEQDQPLILSEKAVQTLSDDTKRILKELGIPEDFINVPKTITTIEKETAAVSTKLYVGERTKVFVRLGTQFVAVDEFANPFKPDIDSPLIPGPCDPELPEPPVTSSSSVPEGVGSIHSIGTADLMVVKQDIQKYEAGEVAHIENVLKGEFRERKHRRARTTEETFLLETERMEESERDLESTERFELQVESQQVINEDTSLATGVTVSAKYGPWVEVTANADYAHDFAREDSKRTATSYARDVSERSVSRIQERVFEQRFRRTVEEFEETNTHGVDNKDGSGHVIGVYRWVDKLYKAQVVNYGRRVMFEFVIPDPGAFLRLAESTKPAEGIAIEKPVLPGYCVGDSSKFVPLSPKDITPEEYLFWVGKYDVPNAEPPPPQYRIVATAFDQQFQETTGGGDRGITKSITTIKAPRGYRAHSAWVAGNRGQFPDADFFMYIGRKRVQSSPLLLVEEGSVSEDDVIPIAIVGKNVAVYAFNVEVLCERTKEILEEWQMATYNAIMTAYNERKAEYDEQIAAAQIQEGVAIRSRNPQKNREIEKTELKKLAISMLTDQHFDLFDAMRKNVPSHGYPQMDFGEAEAEGRYIQFFEQAFEWTHMTYLFYPYFWGRKEDWASLVLLDDEDPLFAKFLQAGSARVQVPVQSGYDEAILYFIESGGQIWNGGDPPHIEDELYVSIVDEVKEAQATEFTGREGTVSIVNGSGDITGSGTDFTEDDIDREIIIEGERYRIADVASPTNLTLAENYRGPTKENVRYSIGLKFIGEPWEVRVPTTLVILQEDASLPDFTQS